MKLIKAQRIRWLGHVKRMEEGAMARKMMEGRLVVGRRKGRPLLRWMDDVVADLKAMRIKQWTETIQDRENGGGLLRTPRHTQGCRAKSDDDVILIILSRGPGSVVGLTTGYGLDGPEIESRWGRDFPHLFRPALGPTQLSVQ